MEVKLALDIEQVQFSLSYTRYCLKYKMKQNNNKKVLLFFIARIYLEVTILSKITQEAFLNEFPKTAKCKLYLILLFYYFVLGIIPTNISTNQIITVI